MGVVKRKFVRVLDGGGDGFRRGDYLGDGKVVNVVTRGPVSSVDELLDFIGQDIEGATAVVICMAGVVENHDLVVESPNAHVLDGAKLATEITKRFGIPAAVLNDMEGSTYGVLYLLPNLPVGYNMTWSSGIGGALFYNGTVMLGEPGHVTIDTCQFLSVCGDNKRGHAEGIIGGKALRRYVRNTLEALGKDLPEGDPCAYLDQAYLDGEDWAQETYGMICEAMGTLLANIRSLLPVPAIVWKGTFALCALKLPGIEDMIRYRMQRRLIKEGWSSLDNLQFVLNPEPKIDSLIGAGVYYERTYIQ